MMKGPPDKIRCGLCGLRAARTTYWKWDIVFGICHHSCANARESASREGIPDLRPARPCPTCECCGELSGDIGLLHMEVVHFWACADCRNLDLLPSNAELLAYLWRSAPHNIEIPDYIAKAIIRLCLIAEASFKKEHALEQAQEKYALKSAVPVRPLAPRGTSAAT